MPNLIYYKGADGVLSRPLNEAEATALLNANFFRSEHVFRIDDDENSDDFCGMDDLKASNGDMTPFKKPWEQTVFDKFYKDLASVLKDKERKRDEKKKQNLVYYKDSDGVVSGPFNEDAATALYKNNFFHRDHVFKIVEEVQSEDFFSISDLRMLNGNESPFKKPDASDETECARVHKELVTLLKKKWEDIIEGDEKEKRLNLQKFFYEMKKPSAFSVQFSFCQPNWSDTFTNKSSTSLRCLIADSWDPVKTVIVRPKHSHRFDIGHYVYIAPHISGDPLDGSEHVLTFRRNPLTPIKND